MSADSGAHSDEDQQGSGPGVGALIADKYRLVRRIGSGGMGSVYEAQHVTLGRRFAIKFLHPELARTAEARARFRREARAAGALESEHVGAVVDFDVDANGTPYLVMEYLVGESLGQLLAREGPLPVPRVIGLVLQVCRGLEVAHAAGVVHRDLKPDNLFVGRRADGSELVKILDFGIAKLDDPSDPGLTRSGAMLGTPFYMSPEQARGDRRLDARVDIYAVGVILYELLTGQKPHPGDSYNSILAHILTRPAPPIDGWRSGLPQGLVEVVHRALAFQPRDRPESAASLARELTRFAAREVLPLHSQIELRAAQAADALSTTASTQPTAPAESQLPQSTAQRLVSAPPGEERLEHAGTPVPLADSTRPTRHFLSVGLLGLGLAVLAGLGLAYTTHASSPSAPALEPANSARSRLRTAQSIPPHVAPLNSPSAQLAPAALSPVPSDIPRERAAPDGTARPTSRAPRATPSAAPPRARVTFDSRNPYE